MKSVNTNSEGSNFIRLIERMVQFRARYVGLIIFLIFNIYSEQALGQRTCLTQETHQEAIQNDPGYFKRRQTIENNVQKYLVQHAGNSVATNITIPVVFHVIHNGDAVGTNENLSDALLLAQLDQLNADFSRMNSDANQTPSQFQGVAANTMIQFCLATEDPNGNPTSGIIRHNMSGLDQNTCWNSQFIGPNIVSPNIWNRDNYLNIFTVLKINNSDCSNDGILGYAYYPGASANIDCAVHAYYTIGSLNNPNPAGGSYGYGRTVTHEVGHWLNLAHIWGVAGCGNDDDVTDTPLQNADNGGCPTFPVTDACTTTSPGVMFMNYMDYVDDQCMNMFTQGQAARMMSAISASRPNFLNTSCGNAMGDGYTCATATEISAAGTFNAPGASEGNGAIAGSNGTHANWYRFTPPATGMIKIFTCGLNGAGNNNLRVYHQNTTSCASLDVNDVVYATNQGCASGPTDPTEGLLLENIPVTQGTPIYIEWDDALDNTNAFSWTLQYQVPAGGGCVDYIAFGLPQDIPDNNVTGLTSIINVPLGGIINGVSLKNLNGTHTWVGDLKFTLISPTGTSVVVIENKCSNMVDFNITLSDNATDDITCPLNEGLTQKPANPLSAFNGENPSGDWKLVVVDNVADDVGALNGWTLQICTEGGSGGDCPPTKTVDETPIANGVYQAGTQLTSMGTINPASDVLFRAGNNIELRPNFSVATNSNFEVRIEGCQ